MAVAAAHAAMPSVWRRRSDRPGAGASSITFWWRRWSEAVALVEMDHVAMAVGEDLDLDVARPGDQLLEQDTIIAEGAGRLALRREQRLGEVGLGVDGAHALAAAAGDRLDQQGKADLGGGALEPDEALIVALVPRRRRHTGLLHDGLGPVLQAHRAHRGGRRADKGQAGTADGIGEVGVLAQEAVAGMDRIGPGPRRRVEQARGVEVRLCSGGGTDMDRLTGVADVERASVGGRNRPRRWRCPCRGRWR